MSHRGVAPGLSHMILGYRRTHAGDRVPTPGRRVAGAEELISRSFEWQKDSKSHSQTATSP
jgi:hypothetical protein